MATFRYRESLSKAGILEIDVQDLVEVLKKHWIARRDEALANGVKLPPDLTWGSYFDKPGYRGEDDVARKIHLAELEEFARWLSDSPASIVSIVLDDAHAVIQRRGPSPDDMEAMFKFMRQGKSVLTPAEGELLLNPQTVESHMVEILEQLQKWGPPPTDLPDPYNLPEVVDTDIFHEMRERQRDSQETRGPTPKSARVFCDVCNANVTADIQVSVWSVVHGPEAGEGGVLWECPQGHELFRHRQWVS